MPFEEDRNKRKSYNLKALLLYVNENFELFYFEKNIRLASQYRMLKGHLDFFTKKQLYP